MSAAVGDIRSAIGDIRIVFSIDDGLSDADVLTTDGWKWIGILRWQTDMSIFEFRSSDDSLRIKYKHLEDLISELQQASLHGRI